MLLKNFLDTVGQTPLLELKQIAPDTGARFFLKLESDNPSGSIKDRPALALIEDGEKRGLLSPGAKILEPTSGNTGIALALIAKLKGYSFTAVMPENASEERKRLIQIYGGQIIPSPADEGSNGAVRLAEKIAQANPDFYMPYQYGNEANPKAHYQGTAPEILRDLPEVTAFVAGLGTGGTLMGVARYFRDQKKEVEIVAAEPMPGERVEGLRSLEEGFIPPILDVSLLNRKILVGNEEAVHYTRLLLEKEGIWTGVSAGANLAAALRVAKAGDMVAIIAPDDGWRYLSSGEYDKELPDNISDTVFW